MVLLPFPTLRQTYDYDCGATAVQGVLAYYGIDVLADTLMKEAGTDPATGTRISGIVKALRGYDLSCTAKSMASTEVIRCLDKKTPVILDIQAWSYGKDIKDWENDWDNGHYTVAIGYDKKRMYFSDPSSVFRTFLTYEELEKRWHDKETGGKKKYIRYGIVASGKKPVYTQKKSSWLTAGYVGNEWFM